MNDFREQWLGWKELPSYKEGNTGKYPKYQKFLSDLISLEKPKRILEIGFNAGHSACCFLNSNPSAEMISFDICRHGTEEKGHNVLSRYFNIRLIPGDSTITVPVYFKENIDSKFDFIFIDGGHSGDVPYLDIKNTIGSLMVNGIIIVDDADGGPVKTGIKRTDWTDFAPLSIPSIEKRVIGYRKVK